VKWGDYYLKSSLTSPTNAEYQRVLTDLFADAVAANAILLPSPYSAEDFEFMVEGQPFQDNHIANIRLKNEPKKETNVCKISSLDTDTEMVYALNTHYCITRAINELL
jgi:hypothetical protein